MPDTVEDMQQKPAARTPGAHRAQENEHVFHLSELNQIMGGPEYSPVYGGCVEGDRMMVAVMNKPAGESSKPHSHPNEQWIYILEGSMEVIINGKAEIAHKGDIVYIPANAIHGGARPASENVVFFTVKDTSHGLHGIKLNT
jgi:quercetin dioxygenase-like cupin family protein